MIEREPGFSFEAQGPSSKEKKKLHKEERKKKQEHTKNLVRSGETYGETKISRRIPEEIADMVTERDKERRKRGFGRLNHECTNPGAPHHIIHFEKFLHGKEQGNPHDPNNLEVPCNECHKEAHKMGIPSGTSIETFFQERNPE